MSTNEDIENLEDDDVEEMDTDPDASSEIQQDGPSIAVDNELDSSTLIIAERRESFVLQLPSLPLLDATVFSLNRKTKPKGNKSTKPAKAPKSVTPKFWPSHQGNGGSGGSGGSGAPSDKIWFKDCGGLEKQINFIRTSVMGPLTGGNLAQYKRFGLEPPKGILFHGAPGTGKTRLAQALSNEIGAVLGKPVHFIYRKGQDIASMYFGESSEKLRRVFAEAKEMKPTVLFFDELDGLCPSRDKPMVSESTVTIVTTMLGLMDELERGDVFVIGSTNRLEAVDAALRRPGRFDKYLEFLPPTQQGRQDILKIHTSKWQTKPSAVLLTQLSQGTAGFSGADLAKLCLDAFDQALSGKITAEKAKKSIYRYADLDLTNLQVTENDWKLALTKMKPSTTGVFGSTQYVVPNKAASAEYIRPLIRENVKAVKSMIMASLSQSGDPNNNNGPATNGVVKALYIWSESESCLAGIDDYLIGPLFGSYGGHEMSAYAKYCLSPEVLFSLRSSDWAKKVNDTFSQAMNSQLPSILYIPHIGEIYDAIRSQKLTEAVNLQHQLERLRDSRVLLLLVGDLPPETLPSPFNNFILSEGQSLEIERPSLEERHEFFQQLVLGTGPVEHSNWILSWHKDLLKDVISFLVNASETLTADNELGSIVALYDQILFEVVSGEGVKSHDDILKSLLAIGSAHCVNRAIKEALTTEDNQQDENDVDMANN